MLLFVAGASAVVNGQVGDFSKSKKKHADKFTFDRTPGEVVLRTGFHYTVSRSAVGDYVLRVFHPEKGVLNTTATYTDEALTMKQGPYTDRFDDGSLYEEGNFERGKRTGPWKECSPGSLGCRTGSYMNGLKEGRWINPDGAGWMTYERGVPHGPFVAVDSLGPDTGYFERGRLVKPVRRLGPPQRYPSLGTCAGLEPQGWHNDYQELDTCSQRLLRKHLVQTLSFPREAMKESIQGAALVEFVVDTNGVVVDARCLKGICASIEAESMRAMRTQPKWNHATQGGRKVKVRFIQPISFRLK